MLTLSHMYRARGKQKNIIHTFNYNGTNRGGPGFKTGALSLVFWTMSYYWSQSVDVRASWAVTNCWHSDGARPVRLSLCRRLCCVGGETVIIFSSTTHTVRIIAYSQSTSLSCDLSCSNLAFSVSASRLRASIESMSQSTRSSSVAMLDRLTTKRPERIFGPQSIFSPTRWHHSSHFLYNIR